MVQRCIQYYFAIFSGDYQLYKLSNIIDNSKDPNTTDISGNATLHYLAMSMYSETTKYIFNELLAEGADINILNSNHSTALHLSASGDNDEFLLLLIQSGAELDIVDKDGRTALQLAERTGNTKNMMALLDAGAKYDSTDMYALVCRHIKFFKRLTYISILIIIAIILFDYLF